MTATRWDCKKYGTARDPIHQSHLNAIAGGFGCPKRFAYEKNEEALGTKPKSDTVPGMRTRGTAIHKVKETYLDPRGSAVARILRGEVPSVEAVRSVYDHALVEAAEGSTISWYGDDPEEIAVDTVAMIRGSLAEIGRRACEIVAVEAPFVLDLDGYILEGEIDLLYRPRANPKTIGLLDWKSGAQRQSQVVLDHGYQPAIYAAACESGTLFPQRSKTDGGPLELGEFPSEIFIVHMPDFTPYKKAGSKTVSRPEEVDFFGEPLGAKVKFIAGAMRGPGFYRANRKPSDVARLRVSLKNIVSTVRLGRFVEYIDEHCARCPFKGPCLTDGHAVDGEEKKAIERALRDVVIDEVI